MVAEQSLALAAFHRRFRHLGMALFLLAAAVELGVLVDVVRGLLPLRNLLLGVFALGTALGAFGTSNDTALHAMLQAEGQLPPEMAAELAQERRLRKARLASLHASPKMAFVLPLVSLAVSLLLLSRLLAAR